MADRYKIVRVYERGANGLRSRTIARGLTLAEAQEHCRDPETSYRTCTKAHNVERTRLRGPWFDGYEQE